LASDSSKPACQNGEVLTGGSILGAPDFVHINLAKKTIVGSQRTTAIRYMEAGEGQLLMQGTELGYCWSL
jgi:hypothetical protein